MKTVETIIAELKRQHDGHHGLGLGYIDLSDKKNAVIDGRVDLEALATAIDAQSAADEFVKYDGEISTGMRFIWMKGTPGEAKIEVTRISYVCLDDPWIYTRVLSGPPEQVGREYGNEMSRFREAVELVPTGRIERPDGAV